MTDEGIENWVGRSAMEKFLISAELMERFVELSGDRSPIHIDDAAAQQRGLRGRVAHGALQAALVSCILGMSLPGSCGMLQELSLRFRRPCYAGDILAVSIAVNEVHASVQTVILKIVITNQNGELVSTGKAQSGVFL